MDNIKTYTNKKNSKRLYIDLSTRQVTSCEVHGNIFLRNNEEFRYNLIRVIESLPYYSISALKEECPEDEILRSIYNTKFDNLYSQIRIWEW